MLLRLIEDGKPEIFHQQIYDLLVIIARIDDFFTAKSFSQNASFFCERAGLSTEDVADNLDEVDRNNARIEIY